MRLGTTTCSGYLGKGRAMSKFHPTRVLGMAAGCLWLLLGGPAMAFFPPLPLGPGPVTVLPPPSLPSTPTAPPGEPTPIPVVPPPPFTPPPTRVVVPQEEPPTPEVPQVVPEPATVVSALAGLAAVAAARNRRRR